MSIKLGLYDFFAYMIPGSIYILVLTHLSTIFGWVKADFRLIANLPSLQILVLAALAYIVGMVIYPIAERWNGLFKPRGIAKKAYSEFESRYSNFEVRFKPEHWGLLLAYIRRENFELSAEIERHNVISLMLKNLSFGLSLLAILQIVEFIRVKFLTVHIAMFMILTFLSILAIRESAKFKLWFYLSIFDAVAAQSLDSSDLIAPKRDS